MLSLQYGFHLRSSQRKIASRLPKSFAADQHGVINGLLPLLYALNDSNWPAFQNSFNKYLKHPEKSKLCVIH